MILSPKKRKKALLEREEDDLKKLKNTAENEEAYSESPPIEDNQEFENDLFSLGYCFDRPAIKTRLVDLILKYDIRLNEWMPSKDQTLLTWALDSQYDLKVLDVILELYQQKGFHINDQVYDDNVTLIQNAMEKGLILQAQLLAHYGVNPVYIDKRRKQTVQSRSLDEISAFREQLLNEMHLGNIKKIIDEFLRSNDIHTPLDGENNLLLHTAILIGLIQPDLKYILRFYKRQEIDLPNFNGITSLMLAIQMNDLSAVLLLLKHKASVLKKDASGKSVLEYAMYGKRNDIFRLIYERAPNAHKTPEMIVRYEAILSSR